MSRDYYYPRPSESTSTCIARQLPDRQPTFSGDSAVWKFFGPISGRRYRVQRRRTRRTRKTAAR
jgi:hypothetical protein